MLVFYEELLGLWNPNLGEIEGSGPSGIRGMPKSLGLWWCPCPEGSRRGSGDTKGGWGSSQRMGGMAGEGHGVPQWGWGILKGAGDPAQRMPGMAGKESVRLAGDPAEDGWDGRRRTWGPAVGLGDINASWGPCSEDDRDGWDGRRIWGCLYGLSPPASAPQMNMDSNEVLPRHFDAAAKWPGMIHEPLDQGNCAGSWAFSTAGEGGRGGLGGDSGGGGGTVSP